MLLLKFLSFASCLLITLARKDILEMDGDIILGGLFPIHKIGENEKECGKFNPLAGYQYMEAMLYAIDKINQRQDILPGIKLGATIYDTCRSPTIVADKTKEFIKLSLMNNSSELAGVIGAFTSGNSVIVANFLRVFRIPQISYGSLTVKLSNKDVYNYFFRTVPPDSYFAEALIVLLQRLGWSYVSIVYSTGTWAETGAQEVIKALKRSNVCLSERIELSRFPKTNEYDKAIADLVRDDELPNVVILVTIQRDSHELLKAKKKNPRANRLSFVGSLEWSNREDITEGLDDIADGTISFGHREKVIPEFTEYLQRLRYDNYSRDNNEWIGEYWQETNRCNLTKLPHQLQRNFTKKCSEVDKRLHYRELAPVQVVINAIQAMANALHAMQQKLCPGTTRLCKKMRLLNRALLLEYLRNVTFVDAAFNFTVGFNAKQEVDGNYTLFNFRRNEKGSFDYVQVGSWVSHLTANNSIEGTLLLNQSKVRWMKGNATIPLSTCRPQCSNNEVSVYREDKCCWECKRCSKNDITVNNRCETCAEGFTPDRNLSHCLKLPLHYVAFGDPLSVFLIFLAFLGILTDVAILSLFYKNREHRLIKAAGREMCYIMFVGICAIFMIPLTSLTKPTYSLCYFRRFVMGISFTICYAPLLMKMWRIHRIFRSANQLRRLRPTGLIGRRSLLLLTFGLIAIQGIFCAFVFNTDPPTLHERFYREKEKLVLECGFKRSAFAIYYIYNIVLVLCCTFYAFLTRHFPKNFNEAMYIGITMYLTCAIWIVFFATFLNADYSITRIYWISASSLVIGWITLLGLFVPKIYQLYTKKEITRDMLLTWGDSTFPRVESLTEMSEGCPRCRIRDIEIEEKNKNGVQELPPKHKDNVGFSISAAAD